MAKSDLDNVTRLAEIGLVVYGIYLLSKFTNYWSANTSGPAPGQSWWNYFFGSGGTLDSQGNFIPSESDSD